MNYRQKSRGWEYFEIILSLIVVFSTAVLVIKREEYDFVFLLAFGAAAVLFFVRGFRILCSERGGHLPAVLLSFLCGMMMVAFFVGSLLTILGGK